MIPVCYYIGKCSNCPNNDKLGWATDSTFMCCACHDILEYYDTRHGPDKITDPITGKYKQENVIIEYVELENKHEIPEEIYCC